MGIYKKTDHKAISNNSTEIVSGIEKTGNSVESITKAKSDTEPADKDKTTNLATLSFVFALLGFIVLFPALLIASFAFLAASFATGIILISIPFLLELVGFITGSKAESNKNEIHPGLAKAAVIISGLGILLILILSLVVLGIN